MKKIILVLFISIILLTGCTDQKLVKQKEKYVSYIQKLKTKNNSTKELPFKIETRYDKLTNNEIRYQVIIDDVKEDIYNIEAIVIHNKQTNDVFPTIGIFDEKQDLLKNKKPSGIILVGYIDYQQDIKDFKCKLKVLIKYETKDEKIHEVYYVTKK